jgi:Zn-dependent M28 family amino/carboxypeptidase
MYGRRAGSEYEVDAAEWIRARFIELGLDPGSTSYMQTFDIPFVVDGLFDLTSQNVLGVLPGQGSLAGQWVILGAHYDHVGFTQGLGGAATVYNGADDNASGTVLMLEVARILSEYAVGDDAVGVDRRSIMFQAYGSEEVGLVGSIYFCGHPTVSMDSIAAMVNLDMVGRLRDATLGLIGSESSALWVDLIIDANKDTLNLVTVDGLMDRSDQYCFFQNQKPVLFLHTGLHNEYHTPQDDVELINAVGMVSVGKLASWVMLDLALRPQPLPFVGGPLSTPPSPGAIDLGRYKR